MFRRRRDATLRRRVPVPVPILPDRAFRRPRASFQLLLPPPRLRVPLSSQTHLKLPIRVALSLARVRARALAQFRRVVRARPHRRLLAAHRTRPFTRLRPRVKTLLSLRRASTVRRDGLFLRALDAREDARRVRARPRPPPSSSRNPNAAATSFETSVEPSLSSSSRDVNASRADELQARISHWYAQYLHYTASDIAQLIGRF